MFTNPRLATAAAGGVAGAIVLLIAHTFTYFSGIEMSPDFQNALVIVGVAIGGTFAHRVSEDQAALHKLILARLGEPAAPPPAPASSAPSSSAPSQPSAAELLLRKGA